MNEVSRFVAQIYANIRNFERNIKRAQASAGKLPDEIEVNVDADISKFRRGLLRAEALAKRFSGRNIVKHISVQFGRSRANIRSFVDEVDKMNDNFQNELMRLAKMISAVGTVIGNVIRGSLIASFSALIPILAGATSAFMAIGNVLGVTAGNLLAFVGALGIAGMGVASYGGLMISVLTRYNDEAFEATKASNRFTNALDGLKESWNGLVDAHEDAIFNQMAVAIDTANTALQKMAPFIDGVVGAVGRMTTELQKFIETSPTMERFFDNLNTKGTGVFENIVRGLGKFTQGLVDMVNAGMPLIEWVAEGFNNLGTQFADWAARMAETNGFHDFISYVQENMPKIGKIFGDFFLGVINLFAAFGENSTTVLDGLQNMMERFKQWSETLKQSDGFQKFVEYIQTNGPTVIGLIGDLVMLLVNFGVAMAPIAQKVLEVVSAFIAWTSELFRTNPVVAQIIGVIITLSGIFMMLVPAILVVTKVLLPFIGLLLRLFTNSLLVKGVIALLSAAFTLLSGPVGVVIGVITALIAVFVMLYQKVEWFRNMVNVAWEFISTFISTKVQEIIMWFNQFREQGMSIFTSAMMAIVMAITTGLMNATVAFITWIAETLAKIVAFGIELGASILNALVQFAANIALGLLNAKNAFITWIAETIARIVAFGVNLVSTIVSGLASFAAAVASGLIRALNSFIQFVANGIAQIVRFTGNIVSTIITGMAQFVSNIISGTGNALAELISFAASGVAEIVSFAANIVSEMASGMANFVSEIISGGANAVSEVVSMGSEIVSSVAGFVGDMVSAGADLIRGLIDGIKSMATAAVDAASNVVGDAVAGAKKLLGINSPSKVFRQFGDYTVQGLVIGLQRNASNAVGAVTSMAKDMTTAFAPDLSSTAAIDSQLGSFDRQIRNTVDADITSGIETQRPQVNVTVRNEGDVEMIRSYIEEEDGIDESIRY